MKYPDIILNTRITPDLFEKSRSVHFIKNGWAFYVRDVRVASNNKYLAWTEIFPLSPSYEWYYLLYWNNGNIAIIKHWLVNVSVGLWTAYDENGDIKEQINKYNKYSNVSPYDILSILAEEKMIDVKEGKSRRISPSGVRFSFKLNYNENIKIWLADINLDFEKEMNSELPVTYPFKRYAHYKIDGDTGEILSVTYDEVEY